jgi:prepilin-type N-terminal cleavage/methylation domain-containing protein
MKKSGFSLTELMVAISVFGMVIAGTMSVFFVSNRSWYSTDIQMQCMREANMILEKMVYGAQGTNGLRSAIFTNVIVGITGSQWAVTYDTPDGANSSYYYVSADKAILYRDMTVSNSTAIVIGQNVHSSSVAVVTNGLSITVQVGVQDGRFAATNILTTYVRYRN